MVLVDRLRLSIVVESVVRVNPQIVAGRKHANLARLLRPRSLEKTEEFGKSHTKLYNTIRQKVGSGGKNFRDFSGVLVSRYNPVHRTIRYAVRILRPGQGEDEFFNQLQHLWGHLRTVLH